MASACGSNPANSGNRFKACNHPPTPLWLCRPTNNKVVIKKPEDEPAEQRIQEFSAPKKSFDWDVFKAKADKDGNGCVDRDELNWLKESVPTDPNSDVWFQKIVSEFDKNWGSDGCATWKEAEEWVQKQIEKQGLTAAVDGLRSLNENKNENKLKLMKWVNG